ncbi:hypothetical protein ACWDR2_25605 [Streptomyces sp. NPDC003631]|uniref:hypothetical protein n=1 Tax=unclassified Streptomyces TaxID=2593676 RepID=UPI0036BBC272
MNERGEFVGVPLAGHPPLLLLELGSFTQLGQMRHILLDRITQSLRHDLRQLKQRSFHATSGIEAQAEETTDVLLGMQVIHRAAPSG